MRRARTVALLIGCGIAGIAALFWIVPDVAGAPRICQIQNIHDGDTLRAICHGETVKIRLYCIDAPEIGQRPWGRESRDYLRRLAPASIRVIGRDEDRYGRLVGEAFDGKTSLNLALVAAGQAAAYPNYCSEPRFFKAQRQAQKAKRGIWKKAGLHQRPWQWRQR